eukprot:TRINITY_DN10062_c0_g1_i6.p1 TRINITY_DN10062_c0_g1~~TRINITY_DN10062_c0_g1_i6.p1  ORF type:complete len:264 (+),score=57.12 TRINITY_DN10062_c0_g1_i6:112-792(+)
MNDLFLRVWIAPQYQFQVRVSALMTLTQLVAKLEAELARVYGVEGLRIFGIQDRNHNDLPLNDLKLYLFLRKEDQVFLLIQPNLTSNGTNGTSTSDLESSIKNYFQLRSAVEAPIQSSFWPTSREADRIGHRLQVLADWYAQDKRRGEEKYELQTLLTRMCGKESMKSFVTLGRYLIKDMGRIIQNPVGRSFDPPLFFPAPPSHLEEIGRAVQQECRDRSRMPSSA